ncbi:MAG: DMT family transporter [Rhodobacteraceae bacterium]|nr:DMT family transporter [Paracoccaceae bacterium]
MQSETAQAAGLALLCMAIVGLIDNFVVIIAEEAGLWQFHLVRAVMVCSFLAVLSRIFGWRLRPKSWWRVVVRSACGGVAMAIYFGSLSLLSIAQAGAGLFTAPIFVLLFSVLFFGQRIGLWRVLAALVGFAGAVLVLRPDPQALSAVSLLPVAAGLSWALAALTTRQLCAEETTATLLFGFFGALGFIGAVGLLYISVQGAPANWQEEAAFFARGWVTPTPRFWFWVGVQATGSVIAIGCLTRAYQIGETSYVAPFEYSFLIFAGFWAWVIWGDTLDVWAFLGIGAIVVSGSVIALRTRDA